MPVRDAVHQTFTRALDALVAQIKQDRTVLAAILCGSLSHDTVWDKSDIDLALVTIDDKKRDERGVGLYADGVNTHVFAFSRTEFRQIVEGSIANSFAHSLLAKGRLLYSHDESIPALCERLHTMGDRDRQLQLLASGAAVLPPLYKAHKWFVTRRDLDYTALWILYAATPLARIEVIGAGLLADREVIPQAMALNPTLFSTVYHNLLNARKTEKVVEAALDAIDGYLTARTSDLYGLVLDHLRDIGETRSATDIEDHFSRNYGVHGVTTVCEYLADRGLLVKASVPVKLTRRSNVEVQELAFAHA
ncbi:MAG TPA: nucleotidyltransferase domain-containing protein [Gemmatimonadaceae bacterium]|nr:nucleotidyltransferase domain-containing protein [Gemmatimonadaceae bacterium]